MDNCSYQQLKTLEQEIDNLRNSVPKARFAFKRSKVPTASGFSSAPESTTPPPASSTDAVLPALASRGPSSQLSISSRSNALLNLTSLDVTPDPLPSHSSLSISSLSSCVVDLTRSSSDRSPIDLNAIHISGLRRVVLVSGFIEGSVMIHNCEDCLFVMGCRQVKSFDLSGSIPFLIVHFIPSSVCTLRKGRELSSTSPHSP